MTVLFEIGEGDSEIEVVDELLDIKKNPCRPGFSLAPPENLILWECQFPEKKVSFDQNNVPDLEKLGMIDALSIFMEEMSALLVKMTIFGSIFMNRAIVTKNNTIEKIVKTSNPLKENTKKKRWYRIYIRNEFIKNVLSY